MQINLTNFILVVLNQISKEFSYVFFCKTLNPYQDHVLALKVMLGTKIVFLRGKIFKEYFCMIYICVPSTTNLLKGIQGLCSKGPCPLPLYLC